MMVEFTLNPANSMPPDQLTNTTKQSIEFVIYTIYRCEKRSPA